jgi:hypothetical protein
MTFRISESRGESLAEPAGARTTSPAPRGTRAVVTLLIVAAVLTLACDQRGEDGEGRDKRDEVPSSVPATSSGVNTGVNNSADRLSLWVDCRDVAVMSDGDLDLWKRRGLDGFACTTQHLHGMGGTNQFSGTDAPLPQSEGFALERQLRDSRVVERARARGMKMYLGFYLENRLNPATPLAEWFDDQGWSQVVVPEITAAAATAKLLGFAGLAFDQELYGQQGGAKTATWVWNYRGNAHNERETRAMVRQRGEQLMRAILGVFPDVQILAYATFLPGMWDEVVQDKVNGVKDAYANYVHINFWDGLSSVEGYSAIRLLNAIFYKTPHLGTWDSALQYEYNQLLSRLSREFSNWGYASSRFFSSPFSWIDGGENKFEAPRSPDYVREQLLAFRKWGMGGEFAIYANRGLKTFDYRPYEKAMIEASTAGIVDSEPPDISLAAPPPETSSSSAKIDVSGSAHDNLAIKVVRWRNDRGGAGVARLFWRVHSGQPAYGGDWTMEWFADAIPLQPGANEIVVSVEDIKGLTSEARVSLTMVPPP